MDADTRYENARAFFDACRKSVGALRSVRDQMDELVDDYGMIGAVRYDRDGGRTTRDHGDDQVAAAVEKIEKLRERLRISADTYTSLLTTAEDVIAAMEADGGCTEGDAETLRYYYLQAEKAGTVARRLKYSGYYIYDKIELATLHAAPYVPASW